MRQRLNPMEPLVGYLSFAVAMDLGQTVALNKASHRDHAERHFRFMRSRDHSHAGSDGRHYHDR